MRNKLNRIKEKEESFLLLGLVNTLRKKKVFVLQFSALIKKKKKLYLSKRLLTSITYQKDRNAMTGLVTTCVLISGCG
jgi:hypothetical protein